MLNIDVYIIVWTPPFTQGVICICMFIYVHMNCCEESREEEEEEEMEEEEREDEEEEEEQEEVDEEEEEKVEEDTGRGGRGGGGGKCGGRYRKRWFPPAGRHKYEWLQMCLPLTTSAAVHQTSGIWHSVICDFLLYTFVYFVV